MDERLGEMRKGSRERIKKGRREGIDNLKRSRTCYGFYLKKKYMFSDIHF